MTDKPTHEELTAAGLGIVEYVDELTARIERLERALDVAEKHLCPTQGMTLDEATYLVVWEIRKALGRTKPTP